MTLRVFNSLTGRKEPFETVEPGKVGMYLCGPTVYARPHIGHVVGPVIFDAVKRYLVFRGYAVTWVVNITDVEDKLIDAANKQNTTVAALATKYEAVYLELLQKLGIDRSIDRFPRASEHMKEIIDLCQRLIANGSAYEGEGNIYFDVAKDADYGKLSHRTVEEQESGLRDVEVAGKRSPKDFALWKAAKPGELSWDSPWGKGRPGWHIECSAMSMRYLGESFDIHGGGLDLKFPHHENELAQSECATGKPFVRYWLHTGLTKIKTKLASGEWADEKMSKSIGNVVDAHGLVDQYGAAVVRYMLLSTHYRSPIEFGDEVMTSATKAIGGIVRLIERVGEMPDGTGDAKALDEVIGLKKQKFTDSMDDDFNTAGAIAAIHELAGEISSAIAKPQASKAAAMAGVAAVRELGGLLGLSFEKQQEAKGADSGTLEQVKKLMIQLRADARKGKNFALADAIRKGLTEIGITLEDKADGTVWRKG